MRTNYLIAALVMVSVSCSKNESGSPDVTDVASTEVTINATDRKQTIRNFGGSDAWGCQFVGLWPDDKRKQVADWLFSTEDDANGQPKGIGLSLWRFNIGAGSAAQDNISDEWRRTEGFLNNDKTYDWSRQAGQQWFLHAAKERGVDQFVGFTNSPPVQLTKNQKAYSSNGEEANISKSNYAPFAAFLGDVVKHFQEEGIELDYLSPFNEPQWDWTGNGQEGTPYKNQEMYDITTKLDSVITARSLNVKIQVGEAGKMNYLYEVADKPGRGNQVEDFFFQSSPRYLGNLANVDKMISAHSYFTSAPMETMIQVRKSVASKVLQASVPLAFWQSEYCVLGDQEEIPGPGKDTGMTTGLYVARLIHHDLSVANASAWHWWTSVSAYDYKDGLVYVEKKKGNGTLEDSKLLWALGNYSRFVRPGAVRVAVSSAKDINNTKGLMVSSYLHEEDKKLVTVIINYGDIDASVKLSVKDAAVASFKPYLTSSKEGDDLRPQNAVQPGEAITIPKKSIVTLVGDL